MPAPSLPPDESLLRKFLAGDLTGPELDHVAAYLDRHPEVASTLNALGVSDTLLVAIKSAAGGASDPPELAALMRRLALLTEASDSPRTPESSGSATPTVTSPGVADPDHAPTADPDSPNPDGVTDDLAGMLAPAQRPDELGRLGHYRVLRLLGRGGMGAVFAAEDDRLKRRVALKVMLPALAASTTARQRFVREAETAAKVEHDNIVPIYDIGEDRGTPFLAMPLLVGETLDDQLKARGGPLAAADALRIGRDIAEGLAAAHAVGLIHRDVKPSNVWLERAASGAFRRARILDFGLARLAREAGQNLTHTGAIMGTPAYMAPEQARGAAVDHRADLFSLGCFLYQMTTGRRPFRGDDTFAILTALAVDHPPAPIELNPACPPALSELVVRLLAKSPADRWPPTAQGVADELARIAALPLAESGSATEIAARFPVVMVAPPAAPHPAGVGAAVTSDATEADGEPLAKPAPRSPRRVWAAVAACLLLFGAAAAKYGGQVIRVVTNEGELVVEVDDDRIEVAVKKDGVVIHDKSARREYVVKAGEGEVVYLDPDGVELVTKKFQIKRGGKAVVTVTRKEIDAARPKSDPRAAPRSDEPKIPSGDSPPAKDAFPGTLVFYDTFDDPKTCKLPVETDGPTQFGPSGGWYVISDPAKKANEFLNTGWFGTLPAAGVTSGRLVARLRAKNGIAFVNFRGTGDADRTRCLSIEIRPNGEWLLIVMHDRIVDGKRVDQPASRVAFGEAPGVSIERGVTMTARWSATDYEVWLDGTRIAGGQVPDVEPKLPLNWSGLQAGCRVVKDGPARFEIDHAAVWEFPPPPDDRVVAESVLARGGKVWVNFNKPVGRAGDLPRDPFALLGVDFPAEARATDADLASLKGCSHLATLHLPDADVTDAGLSHLKDCRDLQAVYLSGAVKVGDDGLAHLKHCERLTILHLAGTQLTDTGLVRLKSLAKLTELNLGGTRVTGAGLACLKDSTSLAQLWLSDCAAVGDEAIPHLSALKKLTELDLRGTKVTEAGAKRLATALPVCRVLWGTDGEIAPKSPPP